MSTVRFKINGREITAGEEKTVLEAATENGIRIPTLCYYKKLSPIGSCRLCLVEVDGVATPVTACQLAVREGISVRTESEELTRLRRMMIQLILVNHPLDCVICERSGECSLQNTAYEFNITEQPYSATKPPRVKRTDWGLIRYNPNLCILCERCIHICEHEQGMSFLRITQTGYRSVIGTHDDRPLDCSFCGSCITVCPVGALSSNQGFHARSWELKGVKSICQHCGVGCTLRLDVKMNRVHRAAEDDSGLNNGSLCRQGRFEFDNLHADRIRSPMIRKGGRLINVSWEEALEFISHKWNYLKDANGPDSIGAIASERLPNEDIFALKKLIRQTVGSSRLDTPMHMKSLARQTSLFEIFTQAPGAKLSRLANADFILCLSDPWKDSPVTGNFIRRALRRPGVQMALITSERSRFKPDPWIRLECEKEGLAFLFLGMARALLDAGLVWELRGSLGEAGRKELSAWALEAGVDAKSLKAAALRMRHVRSPAILIGKEILELTGGERTLRMVKDFSGMLECALIINRPEANSQGSLDMGAWPGSANPKDLLTSLLVGEMKSLYILGESPLSFFSGDTENERIRASLSSLELLIAQDTAPGELMDLAHVVLPHLTGVEMDGTFTNMEGRVQRVRRAVEPPGSILSVWQFLARLSEKLGQPWDYSAPEDIFRDIAREIPGYRNLDYLSIESGSCFVSGEAEVCR